MCLPVLFRFLCPFFHNLRFFASSSVSSYLPLFPVSCLSSSPVFPCLPPPPCVLSCPCVCLSWVIYCVLLCLPPPPVPCLAPFPVSICLLNFRPMFIPSYSHHLYPLLFLSSSVPCVLSCICCVFLSSSVPFLSSSILCLPVFSSVASPWVVQSLGCSCLPVFLRSLLPCSFFFFYLIYLLHNPFHSRKFRML